MKKIVLKILILLISFMIFSIQVYAIEENITNSTNATVNKITEEKPTETVKNETMYVQERCNIRESYSVDSGRVGGLDAGTEVKVVAEYSNGWYKIEYDGGEAYIKAGILRSTKPDTEEANKETEELLEENTEMDEMQQNTDEVDNEYAELINEIGVLPEVGHNIADVLYFGIILLALLAIIIIK